MILSCIRWLVIDHLLQWWGIPAPAWDFRQLENRLEALEYLSDNHYRYYQFYANTLVAILWAYSVNRLLQTSPLLGFGTDLGVALLCIVLFLGSRDTLSKYRLSSIMIVHAIQHQPNATLLTESQAAAAAQVDKRTIRRLIETGRLQALDFGSGKRHHYRIDPAELHAVQPVVDKPAITPPLPRRRRQQPLCSLSAYLPTV
jgi:excisionase family DNA binding protein